MPVLRSSSSLLDTIKASQSAGEPADIAGAAPGPSGSEPSLDRPPSSSTDEERPPKLQKRESTAATTSGSAGAASNRASMLATPEVEQMYDSICMFVLGTEGAAEAAGLVRAPNVGDRPHRPLGELLGSMRVVPT